jgi:lipopolysaccharide/colanic/teichoic acid biosynthesis glycosyltransferase
VTVNPKNIPPKPAAAGFFAHDDRYRQPNRFSDLLIACILLTVTLPLMLFVALAIKCDGRGPIFEQEERIGRHGRRFTLLKFRTAVRRGAIHHITPFGQFLQHTRIDSLPQIVNLLRGDISLADITEHPHLFWE